MNTETPEDLINRCVIKGIVYSGLLESGQTDRARTLAQQRGHLLFYERNFFHADLRRHVARVSIHCRRRAES